MSIQIPSPLANHKDRFRALLSQRKDMPGDLAEFGVYNGGNTCALAELEPTRRVWAFDTFDGMPAPEFSKDNGDHDEPGKFAPEVPWVKVFQQFPNIVPMVGRFVYTLKNIPSDVKFPLVYMDCDLYESYKQVLRYLSPRHLLPNSAIVIDDYGCCEGAKRAVDMWMKWYDLKWEDDCTVIWKG